MSVQGATISGHITGNVEKQLKVFYPFNDFTTVRIIQEKSLVNLDSKNKFAFQINIAKPTFITLYIDYNPIDLFVDNNSDLFVEIHLDSIKKDGHNNWLNITGKYSRGNLYFNEYNFYPSTKYSGVTDFFSSVKNYKLSYLKSSIDSLVNNELRPFDSLFSEKQIDSTFWKIISKNIQALLYFEIIRHPLTSFDERKKMPVSEITNLVDWLFTKCNPLDPDLFRGLISTLYTDHFFLVKALRKENKGLYQQIKDSTIKIRGDDYVISSFYKHFFEVKDKNLMENLWGKTLSSYQNMFKGLVTNNDIQVFKFYFPASKWLSYLKTSQGDTLRTNLNSYNTLDIHYIAKTGNNLQEVLQTFKGKYVLIDLWASWCIPCRQEFSYSRSIDSITKQKNIIRLYISIDDASLKQSWKSAIKEYNLKGYHLLATRQLIKSIKSAIYHGEGTITIPRYVLVDKKGNIVNADAPRPSDLKLKELLKSL